MAVSAITRQGVDALIFRLAQFLSEERRLAGAPMHAAHEEAEVEAETIVIKPPASHFEVERKRKTFHVTGEDVERLAVMTDTDSDEALYRLQRRLKQMGVISALERAGAREGSKVRIGPVEFAWDSSYETEGSSTRSRSRSKRAVGNPR